MKSTQYTEKTLEHFRNPRNVGTLEGPNVWNLMSLMRSPSTSM